MLGERDFLLACVYVLQHIPLHLLHVSALPWPSVSSAAARAQRLGRGEGGGWGGAAESLCLV